MMSFTHNIEKIKGAAQNNEDVDRKVLLSTGSLTISETQAKL